jgi:HTH-type transcriptional regulator/antitoxin HipB
MSTLIQQLKAARLQQGLKQAELGEKIGLPQSHLSKIEQGANDPRLSTITEMARVLNQELVLVPRQMVSAVRALLAGERDEERRFQPDEGETP